MRVLKVLPVAVLAVLAASSLRDRLAAAPPPPPQGAAPDAPLVALVGGVPGEGRSTLHLVRAGADTLPPSVGALEHVPGAVLRARVIPPSAPAGAATAPGDVLVVADVVPLVEPSWGAALVRLRPGAPPLVVADSACHASRPLVTPSGRVFVERGAAGADPTGEDARAGRLRVDPLTVDEVLPDGALRTLWRGRGYTAHLAAARDDTLYLYVVDPGGAALLAVDLERPLAAAAAPARVRRVAALRPFARDFSLDGAGRLVFVTHESPDPGAPWAVERLDPATGRRTTVAHSRDGRAAPHAWPSRDGGPRDRIAWNPDDEPGLALTGSDRPASPAGPGIDLVRAVSPDGTWAALEHHAGDDTLPVVLALRTDAPERALPLPTAPGVRWTIAGFVPAAGGER